MSFLEELRNLQQEAMPDYMDGEKLTAHEGGFIYADEIFVADVREFPKLADLMVFTTNHAEDIANVIEAASLTQEGCTPGTELHNALAALDKAQK